ncbi:hypothetical protein HUJ05_000935 [Dendroctonus ponderosae]|nr:hypothetical protein HUJ05_000935 [Dendroctonus ponderosae]
MKNLIKEASSSYLQQEAWEDTLEYTDNFKYIIKQRELFRIPFLHNSPQLGYRLGVVKYLRNLCANKKFSICCLHLAVYLLDIFMDCHSIKPDEIVLLANVCVLLAAKFEENINNVPKISELNAYVLNRYMAKEYKQWEVDVLRFFSWYIKIPTAAHYIHYYLQAVVTTGEVSSQSDSLRTTFYRIHDLVLEYLDQVIDNIHYMQDFKPSLLAAGIIAASRFECSLPIWSDGLTLLTDYTQENIQGLVCTFWMNKCIGNILSYPINMCTFRDNLCMKCGIRICPKCKFLKKI